MADPQPGRRQDREPPDHRLHHPRRLQRPRRDGGGHDGARPRPPHPDLQRGERGERQGPPRGCDRGPPPTSRAPPSSAGPAGLAGAGRAPRAPSAGRTITPAKPAVSATAAPATASTSLKPSPGHPELLHQRLEEEPFGGEPGGRRQPGRVRAADRPARCRAMAPPGAPRPARRRSVGAPAAADAMTALAVNSSDLATVCATTSVAASSPAATSRRSPVAEPARATPYPARISPLFSTLEYAMTREQPVLHSGMRDPEQRGQPGRARAACRPASRAAGRATPSVRHIP